MNGLMLQREMDSTVDYGIPLIEPKKGFLEKHFKRDKKSKLVDKIPVITRKATDGVRDSVLGTVSKKASTWGWLKYLGRLGVPAQVLSIVAFGTLLGAAYAVTMQTGDRQRTEEDLSVVDGTPALQESVLQFEQTLVSVESELQPQTIQPSETIFQETASEDTFIEQNAELAVKAETETTEFDVVNQAELDSMLSLNTSIDKFQKTVEPSENINSKESVSSEAKEFDVADQAELDSMLSLNTSIDKFRKAIEPPKGIRSKESASLETKEFDVVDQEKLDSMLSLNTSIDEFQKAVELPNSISSKESVSSSEPLSKEAIDLALNKYDQERIKELKQQILSVKQKTEEYNQRNLRLEGKLELFTVKNRALSTQLRQLDSVSDALKARYQIED